MSRVRLYDTTLRDGTQGEGFQLSVAEKIRVAHLLDELGIAWIEGGWPGSNPRDEAFFEVAVRERFTQARLAAFGSTRRAGVSCDDDASIQALLAAGTPTVTIFGKAWRFQATEVLGIDPEANLELIADTVRYLKARVDEVIFDAEHFFDGAADDEAYALAALRAAAEAGADAVVLCDTNGGSLPHVVGERVATACAALGVSVGVHCHNDGELAVANSLEAVRRGATHVQGTINGYGERCGNANLVSILANLELKHGLDVVGRERLAELTHVSRMVDELSNNAPSLRQPFVGASAFAHKGGVHVHAVMKTAASYEHVQPEAVGNDRRILVSDLSGRWNLVAKSRELGLPVDPRSAEARALVDRVKALEADGYTFEDADASLRLVLLEARGERPTWFTVREADVFTAIADPTRAHANGSQSARAVLTVEIGGELVAKVAHGNGPVDALGKALADVLGHAYPAIRHVRLVDYKVRIMDSADGVSAAVRVFIRASDGESSWGTVGVSTNLIEASWRALVDLFEHKLSITHATPAVAAAS
ncbi:MAG: citramalate synthase [Alphaproteobacteria bacterium]|nr:citramalate synthase [Alphaproteobacteria bacterium]